MNRSIVRTFAIAALVVMFVPPVAFAASPEPVNRTEEFRGAGVSIERLQVHELSGIVIIRGRATSHAQAAEVSRIAKALGYERVANLVQIAEHNDETITRAAEQELTRHHSLGGCQFRVNSSRGVVSVAGRVHHELQKDVALQLLRKIDGVQSVEVNLTRF